MKKRLQYFMPIFFGMLSFFFYFLLYHPVPGSEGFITALLVFCAAASWSAVIILAERGNPWILNLYLFFCTLLFPSVIPLSFKSFNPPLHAAAIGLIVLAVVGLKLFIHYYFKYKKNE
jgi:hypothetical protein